MALASAVAPSGGANSAMELMAMLVPMCPGMTTLAFTWGALLRKSLTRASVKPFTANLAAE